MNNVPENELLSAYLDGELTAEEQAQVERLLATDPEARQLVDELRALSSSVKALPPHTIGRDISEEVIRQAKREMPEPAPARVRKHEPSEDEDQAPVWRAIVRRVTRPRNFLWSAVAVAVVVLLMVMNPDTLNGPPAPSVAMKSAADAEQPAGSPGPATSMQAREEAEDVLVAEEAAPGDMPARELAAGETEFGSVEAKEGEAAGMAARRAPSASAAAPRLAFERPAEPSNGAPRSGYPSGAGAADDRDRGKAPRVAERDAYKGQPSLAAKKGGASKIRTSAESIPAKPAQLRRRAVDEPSVLMVVSCDVTAEAQHANVFRELLDRYQVPHAAARVVPDGDTRERVSAGERVAKADRRELQAVAGKPFQVVEVDVEATADQIKALLGELDGRPSRFASVSYTLNPGAVTRGLGRMGADWRIAAQRHAEEALHEEAPTVGEPAGPGMAQQKASRADVDKVLDLARRFQYGRQLGEEAQRGATLGVEAPPAPRLPQKEGLAGAASRLPMGQDGQFGPSKLRRAPVESAPGAAPPRAGRASGAPMQPAAPAEAPATSPADAFPRKMEKSSESESDRPHSERALPKRRLAREQAEEDEETRKSKAAADRLEMARPLGQVDAKQAEQRAGVGMQQLPQQEPAGAEPSGLPDEADRFGRQSGRYRVRFVLRMMGVPGGNVAASVAEDAPAKDAPTIDMAAEAAEAAPEAPAAEMPVPQAPAARAGGAKP